MEQQSIECCCFVVESIFLIHCFVLYTVSTLLSFTNLECGIIMAVLYGPIQHPEMSETSVNLFDKDYDEK